MALAMVVLAGGCSSSESEAPATTAPPETVATTTTAASTTTTSTTTTTQPTTTTLSEEEVAEQQFEADLVLIKQMFRRHSDSWASGIEAGYESLAKYNHPLYECDVDDFRESWALTEGWEDEVILDEDSVERDDGWVIPGTLIGSGEVPSGRIYIMKVTHIWAQPDYPSETAEFEVHATVDAQVPHFFFECRDD